jgi:phage baseplate assembly protein W
MSEASFIGAGWRFPIQLDETGGLGYVGGDVNIEQSLHILLLTDLGQRVMRADFGCKAPQLVFAPGSVQYLHLLETTIREAVRDWEPRVELEEVRAEVEPDEETRVIVSIRYLVRQTNTRNNLVFPFYLGTLEQI